MINIMRLDGGPNLSYWGSLSAQDNPIVKICMDSYVAKFRTPYFCLLNMRRKLDSWVLVYIFFSGLGDNHISRATTAWNASSKNAKPSKFSTITAQLLNESRILAKSSAGTDPTIALFGNQSGKQKVNSTISSNAGPSIKWPSLHSKTNLKKAGYDKATAKCTCRNRSHHTIDDCWFLHLEPRKIYHGFF